jgi:alpha-ribazole phosphatase
VLRIYLVRHGVTVWNREGRWQGHTDVPLSAEGVEQAKLVAERLSGEKIDAVWSSDLQRALHTAEAIASRHDLEVIQTDRLRETMLGEWEGLTIPEIIARGDGDIWQAMAHGSQAHRPPGSESLEGMWKRLNGVRDEVRERYAGGSVVLVGHGGSLRAILCEALAANLACLNRFTLDNASLSALDYTEHRVWVKFVNDTSHLTGAAGLP